MSDDAREAAEWILQSGQRTVDEVEAVLEDFTERGAARVRERVEAVHPQSDKGPWCLHDGQAWPCFTITALTDEAAP